MRSFRYVFFLFSAVFLTAANLSAAIVSWNVPSGDFAVGTYWSTTTIPAAGDTAVVGNGGTATISADFPNTLSELVVGNTITPSNSALIQTAGTIDVANTLKVEQVAVGGESSTYTISGGNLNLTSAAGTLKIGSGGAVSLGAVGVPGGTISTAGVEAVSATSAGVLNFHGGTLKATANSNDFIRGTTNYVHSEGVTFDTQGYKVVLDNSGRLLAPVAGTSGGLTKVGSGVLILTMAANTYTGTTTITEGVLQVRTSLPAASFLKLDGGILQSSDGAASNSTFDFNRNLGTTGGAFQFTANGGGFAGGLGGNFNVNINGATAPVVYWGGVESIGVGIVGTLKLSSSTSRARTNFNNPIDLNAADRTFYVEDNPTTDADMAVLNGVISTSSGTAGIIKIGNGTLLTNSATINTYNGTTTVLDGAFQANDGTGLPTASFLNLDGGILQGNGISSFTRSLGTSGSTFQMNDGGFSARAGAMTVNIGGASATLDWGNASVPGDIGSKIVGILKLGTNMTNGALTFMNPINLNGANRTIQVLENTGSNADTNTISGTIANGTGTGGIIKTGNGALILSYGTYSGTTEIADGALQTDDGIGLPTGSFLNLNGGVLQSNNTVVFTRILGTSGSTFQWSAGGGGFSAGNPGQMTVNIGNDLRTLNWGDASVPSDIGTKIVGPLKLSSLSAVFPTTFQNPIQLNGANRTLHADDNPMVTSDYAEITAVISDGSGGAGGIVKKGAGVMVLSGSNLYSGRTEVQAGALQAEDSIGLPTGSFLSLNGGVLAASSFIRSLGTSGSGKFQWDAGGGGFSAGTVNPTTVNIGNDAHTLEWGSAPADVGGKIVGTLKFNSPSAGSSTTFQNGIDLKGGTRTINVDNNTSYSITNGPAKLDFANVTGVITDSTGGGTLVKTGKGLLVLSGQNTFTGKMIYQGGQLRLDCATGPALQGPLDITTDGETFSFVITMKPNQFGPNCVISFPNNFFAAELALLGQDQTIAGLSSDVGDKASVSDVHSSFTANLYPVADPATLTINNGADYSYNGIIRNRNGGSAVSILSLTKQGVGTQTLEGADISYTGPTTISEGKLRLLNITTAFASSITVNNPGTVEINIGADLTYAKAVTGTGALLKSGTANLTLTGGTLVNYSGPTTIEAGRLTLTSASSFNSDVTNNALFYLDTGLASWTFANAIAGTGDLWKSGTGKVVLSGAKTYTGTTSVSVGTLALGATGSISASPLILMGNLNAPVFDVTLVPGAGFQLLSTQTIRSFNGTTGGTIKGNFTALAGSTISPGQSTATTGSGKLTFQNNLDMSAGANMIWQLTGTTLADPGVAGTNFDQVIVNGVGTSNLTLGGSSNLTLDFTSLSAALRPDYATPDAFWTSNHTWKIIDLTGTATNTGGTNFTTRTNASFTIGNFTTSVGTGADLGDIFLNFAYVAPDYVWSNGAGGNWSLGTNWTTGSAPNAAGLTAKFTNSIDPGATVNLDAAATVGKLLFDNTSSYKIAGPAALTLTPGALITNQIEVLSGNHEIAAATAMTASTSVTVATGNTLTLSGSVSGTGNLSKLGAGNLVFTQDVAYSGNTTVSAGEMVVTNFNAATAGTSVVTVSGSAKLTANSIRANTLSIGGGSAASVPEPATWLLLIVGALVLGAWKRMGSRR